PLRTNQAGRYSHRRVAADGHGPAHRTGQGRKDRGLRRPEEAGPDLPHSQRAREVERSDVRRRYVGSVARRLRLPPLARLPLPFVPGRYLRFAEPDSPLRIANGYGRGRANSSAERKRTLLRAA